MLFQVLIPLSALSAGVLAAGSSSASVAVASASASGSHASGSSAASQTAPAPQSTVFTVSGLSPITVSSGNVQPVLSAIEANSAKVASAGESIPVGTSSLFALEASLLLEEGKQSVGTQTSLTAYITTATGGAPSLVVGKKNTAQGLAVHKGLLAGAATAVCALAVGAAMIF